MKPKLRSIPSAQYDRHWSEGIACLRIPGREKAAPLLPQPLAPAASGDSLDWKDYDAPAITKRVTDRVAPGSIVLFHNAALHTPEALPEILEWLKENGYEVVPVSELVLPGEYGTDFTIDHTGRQIPKT